MKRIKYIVYKEGKYYIAQSLNVDVSSFGENIDEATNNLKEAKPNASAPPKAHTGLSLKNNGNHYNQALTLFNIFKKRSTLFRH